MWKKKVTETSQKKTQDSQRCRVSWSKHFWSPCVVFLKQNRFSVTTQRRINILAAISPARQKPRAQTFEGHSCDLWEAYICAHSLPLYSHLKIFLVALLLEIIISQRKGIRYWEQKIYIKRKEVIFMELCFVEALSSLLLRFLHFLMVL